MSRPLFRIEPLGKQDRSRFTCGSEPLDGYFRTEASQDIRRRVAACYIALENDSGCIAGFYTLSASQVVLGDLPEDIRRKLPRYPAVAAVRLGRLAVDQAFKGRGLGGALLVDAAMRALRSEIAAFAMVVDAKDERAAAFYRHHGILDLSTENRTMFVAMALLAQRLGIIR
ncbi:MAG: GNAT family N-acetyltransferase [Pseudomonadota bacterium]|nr:GNAT family N-acetyltransferase [Pseudomonadota bacterium]